jgi:transcription elongation GreA/GreB family factor
MSRAFVKEDSDAPEPPPLERPVSAAPNRVTPRGLRLIGEEVARIEAALAAGPDAGAEALLRRDLRYWTKRRASAQPVAPDPAPIMAGFGARVTIRRGARTRKIEIVGEDEANPGSGRIAWTSPLARALDGAEPGETVELGSETVDVLAVAPGGEG